MRPVFEALVPGWRGELPPMPRHLALLLRASTILVTLAALLRWGRPFRLLSPERREELLDRLYRHPLAPVRFAVQWWKLLALVGRC